MRTLRLLKLALAATLLYPTIFVNTAQAQTSNPAMSVDQVGNGADVYSPFLITGWAIDRGAVGDTGVNTVHIWAFPRGAGGAVFLGVATYGLARPDVAATFGGQYENSGFALTTPEWFSAGNSFGGVRQFDLVAYAFSTVTGSFNQYRVVTIVVRPPLEHAVVQIDTPAQSSTVTIPFTIAGWAVDGGAPIGTGIEAVFAWAFPRFPTAGAPIALGFAAYDAVRGDVGALFGARFTNSGFHLTVFSLPPGTYDILVYARSSGLARNNAGFVALTGRIVSVSGQQVRPAMSLDLPVTGTTPGQPLHIAGWAIDLADTSGVGIDIFHVYAFPASGGAPVFLGQVHPNNPRPDVGAMFGSRFLMSGFNLPPPPPLPPGDYFIVAYARLKTTQNWIWRASRVTLP